MILAAECYSNACFAEELKKILYEERFRDVRIIHKHVLGRDRILKDSVGIAEKTDELVIAIIDYEKGVARAYIEKQFRLFMVYENILLGSSVKKGNLLAIVFDPNIKEGLLCKVRDILCRNPSYYNKIKSSDACNIIARYLKEDPIQKILSKLVMDLRSMMKD